MISDSLSSSSFNKASIKNPFKNFSKMEMFSSSTSFNNTEIDQQQQSQEPIYTYNNINTTINNSNNKNINFNTANYKYSKENKNNKNIMKRNQTFNNNNNSSVCTFLNQTFGEKGSRNGENDTEKNIINNIIITNENMNEINEKDEEENIIINSNNFNNSSISNGLQGDGNDNGNFNLQICQLIKIINNIKSNFNKDMTSIENNLENILNDLSTE